MEILSEKKTSFYKLGNHKRFFNVLLLQLEQQNYHHLNCHLDLSIFMISLTLQVKIFSFWEFKKFYLPAFHWFSIRKYGHKKEDEHEDALPLDVLCNRYMWLDQKT